MGYDQVTHVASTIMWCGRSYTSVTGRVECHVNSNNDLVVHYLDSKTTVTHHHPGGGGRLTSPPRPAAT